MHHASNSCLQPKYLQDFQVMRDIEGILCVSVGEEVVEVIKPRPCDGYVYSRGGVQWDGLNMKLIYEVKHGLCQTNYNQL